MQDKFCINCKKSFDDGYMLFCNQFVNWQHKDVVTGIVRTSYSRCSSVRKKDNECGPEGNLFEPTFKYKVISIIKGVFK